MSLPTHHPGDTLLIDYAGGGLPEGAALAVATHLALCPCCRLTVTEMEAIGGALLDEIEPEELSPGCLEAVMARLDRAEAAHPRPARRPTVAKPAGTAPGDRATGRPRLPEPLARYVGPRGLQGLRWRFLQPGMSYADLPAAGGGTTRLIRMKGGIGVPQHTHGGIELTVVLEGGFHDELGQFQPGDMAVGDPSVRHSPVSDPEGCLCLAATIGGLRLTGPIGRLFNRFVNF